MWNKWGVEVVQQNISDDDDLFFFQKDIYIKKNYTSNFLSFHFAFCISRCSLQQRCSSRYILHLEFYSHVENTYMTASFH